MLQVRMLPLGPLQTNCYLAACDETMKVAVIDPSWSGQDIARVVAEEGWNIAHVLLTHAHFDHVGGLAELREVSEAPIHIHPDAVTMLQNATKSAAQWGMHIPQPPEPDELLSEGQVLEIGNVKLHVLYTPGHAPGHVAFHAPDYKVLFNGDVLFQQGIGRTDLPGGDYHTLMTSIREKLLVLPNETQVLSGHGNPTTIGAEKRFNPFLQDR